MMTSLLYLDGGSTGEWKFMFKRALYASIRTAECECQNPEVLEVNGTEFFVGGYLYKTDFQE